MRINMKKFYVFVMSLFMAISFAHADISVPNVSQMSKEQVEMLKKQIEIKEAAPEQSTTQKVSEWANIGKNVGEGLVATAKELGVAANDFAKTDLGKLTIIILLWHFFGKSLVILAFCVIYPIFIPFIMRYFKDIIVGYNYREIKKNLFGKEYVKTVKDYNDIGADGVFGLFVIFAILVLIEIVFIVNL